MTNFQEFSTIASKLYLGLLNQIVHPGIIHFSNNDQLGQFMNRALVGLGGKYL